MKRTLSEKNVLKNLEIADFRHMSKGKEVQFVSMLPYMDSEVAKIVLEQFPEFRELAGQIVIEYRTMVENLINDNFSSNGAYFNTGNSILDALKLELTKDNLSDDEREHIVNKMIEVAQVITVKDSENKKFILKVMAVAGITSIGILGATAVVLGLNVRRG